jgi:hypothetical protein
VTRQFAHLETLERARRWLIQAGINPSRIEEHTHGAFRIMVTVEPGEAVEVERVLDAAESSDPSGNPSFWDTAREQHVYPESEGSPKAPANPLQSESLVAGWRPQNADREVTQTNTETQRQIAFREGKD